MAGGAAGRRAWQAVGGTVIAVVVVLAGVQVWTVLVQQHLQATKVYERAARVLALDTGSAQVTVQPGLPDRVSVRRNLDWTLREPVVSMTWAADVLTVSVSCGRLPVVGGTDCDVSLDIEVPAGTQVSGRSTSGSTEVRGLTGDVRLTTTSGAILLAGLGGQVTARSSSGMIQGGSLASARVRADTGSGQVRLAFARPPDAVSVSAGSGEIGIVVPAGSRYRITGRSRSGDGSIDPVLADPGSQRSIDVAAGSGRVTVAPSEG